MHALMDETLQALTEQVEAFCQKVIAPRASEIDQSNAFPRDLWPRMGELGLHGITVAEEYDGVNLGYLGFLSEATLADLEKSIRDLIHKKYRLLSRMLIKCELRRNGKIEFSGLALNDAVIHKADTPRLIRVRIFSGGRFVFDTRCDGVVASTPTGSTAYSLAAGGPILAPDLRAIVLNPLNPHLLTIRSMVFSRRDSILMRVHGLEAPAALQLDGVTCSRLQENDEVLIRAAKEQVQFIKLSNRTFYQILRRKMNLGK